MSPRSDLHSSRRQDQIKLRPRNCSSLLSKVTDELSPRSNFNYQFRKMTHSYKPSCTFVWIRLWEQLTSAIVKGRVTMFFFNSCWRQYELGVWVAIFTLALGKVRWIGSLWSDICYSRSHALIDDGVTFNFGEGRTNWAASEKAMMNWHGCAGGTSY